MKLRPLLLAGALALGALSSAGADQSDLQWQLRIEPQTVKAGDEAEIVFSASIPEGLILYSSDFDAELGPRPAKFVFAANDAVELQGPVSAVQAQRRKDKVFGSEYTYFANRAEFRQKVRVLKTGTDITGRIDGQTCQERDGTCFLFKEPFSVRLN
ncbi:protein-disulfide reductase DsbD domain-containing protein [Steroidobacter cummioxidans]|uniref:protein-disulfide reductase DsbD domain-containing protein n=1 Tax=Steroidobacter cummioxidans TaxID=1803913 RepID=UPI000E310E60|nr:protein-disulfide reductase DsbD domain-containing protein [Steroidobacter cummioxidans]